MKPTPFHHPTDCPDENTLVAFLQGQLAATELATVEANIDRCPACTELVIELASVFYPEESNHPSGPQIGRYQVEEQLGKGGMGVVYKARDTELGRSVALKLLRPDFVNPELRQELTKRLRREAQLLASLSHPHILAVYDIGEWNDNLFIATQFVKGSDLRKQGLHHSSEWRTILSHYCHVGEGLAVAHQQGIIHRDVKPDNILVAENGHAYLTDFGLAQSPTLSRLTQHDDSSKAQQHSYLGTPSYSAPEQYSGDTTVFSDQFAFCVSLYESLYGYLPFLGKDITHRYQEIVSGKILPPPLASRIPKGIFRVLKKGMHPNPGARYASMEELVRALQGYQKPTSMARWLARFPQQSALFLFLAALTISLLIWNQTSRTHLSLKKQHSRRIVVARKLPDQKVSSKTQRRFPRKKVSLKEQPSPSRIRKQSQKLSPQQKAKQVPPQQRRRRSKRGVRRRRRMRKVARRQRRRLRRKRRYIRKKRVSRRRPKRAQRRKRLRRKKAPSSSQRPLTVQQAYVLLSEAWKHRARREAKPCITKTKRGLKVLLRSGNRMIQAYQLLHAQCVMLGGRCKRGTKLHLQAIPFRSTHRLSWVLRSILSYCPPSQQLASIAPMVQRSIHSYAPLHCYSLIRNLRSNVRPGRQYRSKDYRALASMLDNILTCMEKALRKPHNQTRWCPRLKLMWRDVRNYARRARRSGSPLRGRYSRLTLPFHQRFPACLY